MPVSNAISAPSDPMTVMLATPPKLRIAAGFANPSASAR